MVMRAFLLLLLCSSHFVYAKGDSKATKMPMIWVSGGGGKMNVTSPKDDFKPDNYANFEIGGQMPVFKNFTRLQFAVAAFAGLSNGKMNYQYSNPPTNYTATDLEYQMSNVGVRFGPQLRLIDSGWFRLFVEGGGYTESTSVNYDTVKANLLVQGSTYIKSEKDSQGYGWYADGGLDLRIVKFGVRLGVRQFNGRTGKLKALNNRIVEYRSEIGYLAVFKEF